MKTERRKMLENVALLRLKMTANDEAQWSFIFESPGAISIDFWRWSDVEFFDGEIDDLELPWSPKRVAEIKAGDLKLTKKEFEQWQRARCENQLSTSDWVPTAWIVPLREIIVISGYALFVIEGESDPVLYGVFDNIPEASAFLALEGYISPS